MPGPGLKLSHILALAACLAAAVVLGEEWERKLVIPSPGGAILRAQAADEDEDGGEEEDQEEEKTYTSRETRTEKGTSQRIFREGTALKAEYNFINFNKDRVGVNFGMQARDYKSYLAGYGYSDAELADLRAWREEARQAAWKTGYLSGGKPAGEKAMAEVVMEYDTRLRALLRARGMALRAGNLVECDIPLTVKRNVPLLKPLALALQKIASERGYSEEELVGAALSLVQTALRYKIPPSLENGFHTGGLLPPARALLSGWGDCDTKSGLLASILGNWNTLRMVGIAVPGHYLMAVRRLPAKGDVFVRYQGLEYVLVEPAGPAWLEPGTVGTATSALLAGAEGYRVEPFF
jgi:hypothetical protein